MKRQKKYTSEKMVLKDIDASIRKRNRLLKQAEEIDAYVELIAMVDNPENVQEIREKKEEAKEKRAKATRINETRLQKLKQTLSAFKSEQLPGMFPDNQVVLQPK